ncbi:hypothetical protein CTI12_AA366300 [Artemisia annua]|nr:hypothetical protein CTI12_AA366300 [Artemisia annua]
MSNSYSAGLPDTLNLMNVYVAPRNGLLNGKDQLIRVYFVQQVLMSIGKQWKELLDYNDIIGFIFHIILTRSIFQRTAKAFLADNLHCRLVGYSMSITPFLEINGEKNRWNIKVKITTLWNFTNNNQFRLRDCAKEDYFGGHAKTVTMDDGVDLELGFMDDVKTFMPNW